MKHSFMVYFKGKVTEFLILRIGTRGSPLALWQAHAVQTALAHASARDPDAFPIVPMVTQGDRLKGVLADFGGKGLFTKELDLGLVHGDIDLAVHSLKDLATVLEEGIVIGAVLPREDPRDAWISPHYPRFSDLPLGARIGTCSLRRAAQIRGLRPDLEIVPLRGNVGTRLEKIRAGAAEGTLLAYAGLKRLGLEHVANAIFPIDVILPAVAQGAIVITCRAHDQEMISLLSLLNDPVTALEVEIERTFLHLMNGSCRTPLAAYAHTAGEVLHLTGMWSAPDGSKSVSHALQVRLDQPTAVLEAPHILAQHLQQDPLYQPTCNL